ncbi:probable RNA-binding protein EIF1AD isoform X2 [Thamnophis elegans]|uniref:probable RNA-binding protein EIF1AD isoform X2 n=1 Tax=Thamnophis elegans TaxID=35005 RepID=UPI0013774B3F|nr:probable RNA-binding protein EIF1AD isoform X2 [Thamnophis elegans]
MSQATKRKHVVKEVLGEYVVPSERQQIVRVLGTPGNNLHEVETPEGARFLVSMPNKFRKNIWIKRGDFLLVDPIEEGEKVKAEISFVLYKDHVQYLKKEGYWPDAFLGDVKGTQSKTKESREGVQSTPQSSGEEDSEDDDTDLFVNTNRITYDFMESEESSDSEEEEK